MIGTLIAQDYRATKKALGATIGIALLVAAVSLMTAALRVPIVGSIGLVVGVIAAVSIVVVAFGVLVGYYWRTMYGREGYFTMTIPVPGRTLFAAKVLYALAAAAVAALFTALALVGAAIAFSISQHHDPLDLLRTGLGMVDPWMAWLAVASLLLQTVFLVVVGAAVMSIGAQARFNHLGFGAAVIGAVIVYVVMQVVTFAAIMFVPVGLVLTGPDAGTLVPRGMLPEFIAALSRGAQGTTPAATGVLGLGFVLTTVLTIGIAAWWGARSVERRTSLR
ncbi:hypothetical protein ACI3KS_15375 [Microbacterium sp. ZW T5_45]|uniref:hypothetical protein n=1 Tax=Microbacterium sp. ZW T5_45 TaxID=3378080 RepID=UPI003855650E